MVKECVVLHDLVEFPRDIPVHTTKKAVPAYAGTASNELSLSELI
jgi:hypothetical protein